MIFFQSYFHGNCTRCKTMCILFTIVGRTDNLSLMFTATSRQRLANALNRKEITNHGTDLNGEGKCGKGHKYRETLARRYSARCRSVEATARCSSQVSYLSLIACYKQLHNFCAYNYGV